MIVDGDSCFLTHCTSRIVYVLLFDTMDMLLKSVSFDIPNRESSALRSVAVSVILPSLVVCLRANILPM